MPFDQHAVAVARGDGVAFRADRKRHVGVFAAAYVLSLGAAVLQSMEAMPLTLALAAPLLLVMVVVPGLVSRYWSQRRTLTDTLREYHAQLLRERAMIAGQARMRYTPEHWKWIGS